MTAWIPTDLGGMEHWYDFSDNAYRVDDKGSLNAWSDRSGNDRTIALTTVAVPAGSGLAASTINTVQAYTTGGDESFVRTTPSNQYDESAVYLHVLMGQMPTAGSNDYFFNSRDDAGAAMQTATTSATTLVVGTSAANFSASYVIGTSNVFLLTVMIDMRRSGTTLTSPRGSRLFARLDGDLTPDNDTMVADTYNPTNVRFGLFGQAIDPTAGALINGKIGEQYCYKKTGGLFSTDEIQRCEGYTAHKFNHEASLPVTHPYRAAPPGAGGGKQFVINRRREPWRPRA